MAIRLPMIRVLFRGSALLALSALCSCGTSWEWQEVNAGEMAFEDVWVAMVDVAQVDGYPIDQATTDRGMKIFQSRWRTIELPFRQGSRKRVHAEFEQREKDWWVLFYVERQKITDIDQTFDPEEDAWSGDGQDTETERRFGVKLARRFRDAADREDGS